MADLYHWVKAAHIVSVIAWMAGLLYLPRLFVYHADASPGGETSETFKVMERRLYRAIMTPAMAATWLFGLGLAALGDWWTSPWLLAKLVLVVALSAAHDLMGRWRRDFEAGRNRRPARFFRIVNEVPTLLLVAIVVLVVVKPF